MKKIGYLLGAAALVCACGKSPQKQQEVVEQTDGMATPTTQTDVSGFYEYAHNGDTVSLHITPTSDKAVGTLTYALKEKDRNTGTFEGHVQNGVLLADYTFTSEGQSSVRQVAFKIDGTTAAEGYGDAVEKNGGMVFKDASKIEFGNGLVLTKK